MNTALFAFVLLLLTAVVSSEVLARGGGFEQPTDEGGVGVSEVQNAGAEGSRRLLHEPFVPTISIAPSPGPAALSGPPAEPPTASEQPGIPTINQPFFPVTPSLPAPPPPDPTTSVTIPANISGLIPPQEESSAKSNGKPRKIIVATVVISSVIFALSALLFYLNRRRARDLRGFDKYIDDTPPLRSSNVRNGSDSVRAVQSPAPVNKVAFNGGSDVLYLGTLEPVPSRNSNGDNESPHADPPPRSDAQTDDQIETHNSPYHTKSGALNGRDVDNDEFRRASTDEFRRESPEIYPLPPLSKRLPPSASMDSSDEESFYSPGCPSTPSSSRDNSDSPGISICKRLFSPPPQQSSRVSLQPLSSPSYPSSATSSSSPSPLNSPPPPITPTVLPPPIRSHLHSSPPSKSEPQPPIVLPSSQQVKPPPPPPPPPPAPLFQLPDTPTSPPVKHKPIQVPLFQLPDPLTPPPARQKPNPKSNLQSSPFPSAEQKRNLPSPSSPPAKHSPDPQPSPSTPVKQKPDPESPPSPPATRSPQPTLPPLPARPPPRFFNSSRSGKLSQLPPPLSKQPPPPPPLPAQNKNTSPESPLPPLPLRPPYRAQLPLFNSARTVGQSSQSLAPAAAHSIPANSAEQFNATGADGTPRPKLKPLHWDKVRASPDRAMVWDQLKSGSFQLNEEMIETLFVYNTTNTVKSEAAKRPLVHPPGQNQRILDPKKSQNIAIQLRALNVTREEVCDALLEGTCETLGTELLETLVKMAPSKEEEVRLKEYNADISKLGPAERFLKGLLDIPFAFKRIDAMLYRANFEEEVNYIKNSFETLEVACEELRSSRLFLKLLEAVLKTGNRMNVGTIRGDAQAFKLDTLLKLADVKGTDGKTTLLHFVVQEIIRAEGTRVASTGEQPVSNSTSVNIDGKVHPLGWEVKGLKDKEDDYRRLGLQVVAGLSTELSNVKKAAGIDSDALTSSVSQLARGLGKLREILQVDFTRQTKEGKINEKITQENFYKSMASFLHQAEEDIGRIQNEEMRAFSHVKEITEYFHGDAAKEEAHPFRIFVIVRDFLGVLQQVCKEVARMQTKNTSSPARLPPVSVHTLSRPLFPQFQERKPDSSDDESSSP